MARYRTLCRERDCKNFSVGWGKCGLHSGLYVSPAALNRVSPSSPPEGERGSTECEGVHDSVTLAGTPTITVPSREVESQAIGPAFRVQSPPESLHPLNATDSASREPAESIKTTDL